MAKATLAFQMARVEALRFENERKRGLWIQRQPIVSFAADLIQQTTTAFESIAAELADKLALERDPAKCRDLVDAKIRAVLTNLARWKPE
jgi:hypothetical protein